MKHHAMITIQAYTGDKLQSMETETYQINMMTKFGIKGKLF